MSIAIPIRYKSGADGMSARARAYLTIATLRHLIIGAICAFAPQVFISSSYDGMRQAVPFFIGHGHEIEAWGFAFGFTGVACAIGAITGSEAIARWALLLSVITTGAVGGAFLASLVEGTLIGPTHPIIWLAVAFKDLTMLRSPMQNPFEPVIRRVLDKAPPVQVA